MTEHKTTLTFLCAMSGERETLTVKPAGMYGVQFVYGDDASVIVRCDDLVRLRSLIDQQMQKWMRHRDR